MDAIEEIFVDDFQDKSKHSSQYQDDLLNFLIEETSDKGGHGEHELEPFEEEKISDSDERNDKSSDLEDDSSEDKVNYGNVISFLTHEINGEMFYLDTEDGFIYLTHPKWSLVGSGENIIEAEMDMLRDARIISETYFNTPDEELSDEARKMKTFLYKFIY